MLEGLMQHDFPLTLNHVLNRMRTLNAGAEIVTLRAADGSTTRATHAEVASRVDQLAGALTARGIGEGDRIGTFAWNSQEHIELYLAIPCMGSVLHTLNIRLFPEQLAYVINHARDRIVFVDDSLVPLLEKVAPLLNTVELFVVIGNGSAGSLEPYVRYDDLLREASPLETYPTLDERAAASLCYTSGTTGDPKGVLYSHRSTLLHSVAAGMVDTLGVSRTDRVLPVVPQFHANAWGLIYAAGLLGASIVQPGRFLQAEHIVRLIESEKVTFAAAVPTIWTDILNYLDAHPDADVSSIRTAPCGGAAIPASVMTALEERHGIELLHAWGMTETSPIGAVARPPAGASDEARLAARISQGRPAPLVELRIVDDAGIVQPWDGVATGEIQVRGPWIASGYYLNDSAADRFEEGWLRTGDIASVDPHGYVRISDRSKDIIKSGGEWVSSVELENELMSHDAVREAAVIAIADERYSERPLACVVLHEDRAATAHDLRDYLVDRVAKWWIPESFAFIDEVPKTSVGKFDKKALRQRLADGELTVERSAATRVSRPASS